MFQQMQALAQKQVSVCFISFNVRTKQSGRVPASNDEIRSTLMRE